MKLTNAIKVLSTVLVIAFSSTVNAGVISQHGACKATKGTKFVNNTLKISTAVRKDAQSEYNKLKKTLANNECVTFSSHKSTKSNKTYYKVKVKVRKKA